MPPEDDPRDEDPHAQCAHEIHELQAHIQRLEERLRQIEELTNAGSVNYEESMWAIRELAQAAIRDDQPPPEPH